MRGSCWLPLPEDAHDRVLRDLGEEAVQVVAFVGHAKDGHACSAALINSIINKDLISPNTTAPVVQGLSVSRLHAEGIPSLVEVHHDPEGRTIYLSLAALDDPAALLSLSQQLSKQDLEHHSATLAAADNERVRALLFLFLVSTTVVLVQASSSVDPYTLQLLRVLELLKADAVNAKQSAPPPPSSSRKVSAHGVSSLLERFVSSAQVPELFLLLQPSLPLAHTAHRLNRMHKALEEQVQEVFRVARLHSVGDPRATHPDYTHLFRLPEAGFVFIHPRDATTAGGGDAGSALDPVISLLDKFSLSLEDMALDTGMNFGDPTATSATATSATAATRAATATTTAAGPSLSEEVPQLAANLHHRLRGNVQTSSDGDLSDTFAAKSTAYDHDDDEEEEDDDVDTRERGDGLFSSAALFVRAANALYGRLVVDACPVLVEGRTPKGGAVTKGGKEEKGEMGASAQEDNDHGGDHGDAGVVLEGERRADHDECGEPAPCWFEPAHHDVDRACKVLQQYSVASCRRALSHGMNQYHINLPRVYDERTHRHHVSKAAAAFMASARGPLVFRFLNTLTQRCDQEWDDGRRQCRRMSLTRRRCMHPLHLTPQEAQREVDIGRSEVVAHSSGVTFRCTCVCGRSQRVVPDAFDTQEINAFVVEEDCCRHVITSVLPLATQDAAKSAGTAASTAGTATSATTASSASNELLEDEDVAAALVFGGAGGSMQVTSKQSSWPMACFCLFRLGGGASYVSKRGLQDQRGFLPNAHHLVPCVIYEQDTQRPHTQTRRQRQKDRVQVARLYVGYEYETESGKRFIAHGQDATVRVTNTGKVQGSARKSLDAPMPICMPVPKKSVKEQAQLVRMHVVVPNAPLTVQLQPTVQIKGNMSMAVTTRAVVLPPNGHYVLHFPRVFTWHDRPVLIPTTPEAQKHFVLCQNPLTVVHEPG